MTQIDMRIAEVRRFERKRPDIEVNLYNLLNTNDRASTRQTFPHTVAESVPFVIARHRL